MNCSYSTRSCAECWSMRTTPSSRSNMRYVRRSWSSGGRSMASSFDPADCRRRRSAASSLARRDAVLVRGAARISVSTSTGAALGQADGAATRPDGGGARRRRCRARDAPRARPRARPATGRESAPPPWPGGRSRRPCRRAATMSRRASGDARPESWSDTPPRRRAPIPPSRMARPFTERKTRRAAVPTSAGRSTSPSTWIAPCTSSTSTNRSAKALPQRAPTRSRSDEAGGRVNAARPSWVTARRTSRRSERERGDRVGNGPPFGARAA